MGNFSRLRRWVSNAYRTFKSFPHTDSKYIFSFRDRLRYFVFGINPGFYEKYTSLSHVQQRENGFNLVHYKNQKYYWPADEDTGYLPWLYAETFEPAWINYHSYEYGKVRIRSGDIVYDFGACEGFFVRFALLKGAAKVVAFEPTVSAAEALKHSFYDEICHKQVDIVEAAVGDKSGLVEFTNYPGSIYDNCVMEVPKKNSITVPQKRIDDVIQSTAIDFLKMDIEGGEMDALLGGSEILRTQKPKLAIAVYHGFDNAQMCKEIIKNANPAYTVIYRGIYFLEGELPRPAMIYAW